MEVIVEFNEVEIIGTSVFPKRAKFENVVATQVKGELYCVSVESEEEATGGILSNKLSTYCFPIVSIKSIEEKE
jgi:hypothetical protein